MSTIAGTTNQPGQIYMRSNTTGGGGYYMSISTNSFVLSGGEKTHLIFRMPTLINSTFRFGFIDSTIVVTDGVYFDFSEGNCTGRTENNNAMSITSTDYALNTTAWYNAYITIINTSYVSFELYDSPQTTLLWNDTLTTNIPSTTGRETGHGLHTLNSGVSQYIVYLDFIELEIDRTLSR